MLYCEVQGNRNGFKLNDTHQLVVYAADVTTMGRGSSVHTLLIHWVEVAVHTLCARTTQKL